MENMNILIVLDNMVVNNFIVIVRVSFLKQLVILLFDWLQICMVFFKVVQKINFNKVNNYSVFWIIFIMYVYIMLVIR